ncbi:MAG: hypothetical protein IJT41_13070, partial [Clostridia bacterium]|nr:hypothetical protein [Clostridia bacterium]
MNDFRIVFGTSGVDFPDGTCLGVKDEHNAARLALQIPPGMIEGATHHVVRFQTADTTKTTAPITTEPNVEGSYRDGNTLYVPLTKDVTNTLTLSLRVLAITKVGSADGVLDSTDPAQGLWFHAADGAGGQALSEIYSMLQDTLQTVGIEIVSTLPSEVTVGKLIFNTTGMCFYLGRQRANGTKEWLAVIDHSHLNKSVIDKISEREGRMLFDGKPIAFEDEEDDVTLLSLTAYNTLSLRD